MTFIEKIEELKKEGYSYNIAEKIVQCKIIKEEAREIQNIAENYIDMLTDVSQDLENDSCGEGMSWSYIGQHGALNIFEFFMDLNLDEKGMKMLYSELLKCR